MEIRYKKAEAEDFDKLWPLVEESLAGKETKLTRDRLREDLFGKVEPDAELLAGLCLDPDIEFDFKQAGLTYPVCLAITAHVDGQLVGFLIFHRYYSPWEGRSAFIKTLFVSQAHRGKKIATGLWLKCSEFCRNDRLAYVVFETSRIEPGLKDTLARHGSEVLRDDNSNWSAFTMDLR